MAKQTETPQVAGDGLATQRYGGESPKPIDISRSANARGGSRHEMKGTPYADMKVLPTSAKMAGNEMVGIKDDGYLVKKNIPYGNNAHFLSLPPGMDIEDQENADIREMKMTHYSGGISFPSDGWS